MAILNPTTVTVDAILTTKGRELLARNDGSFQITQFALADDEIDYTLYNPNHPSGSAFYGEAIENTPVLEAFPNESQIMRYKLVTLPRGTAKLPVINVGYNNSISATIAKGDVKCYGQNNGSARVTVTSSLGLYSVSWTGPASYSSTNLNITSLNYGTYYVTVTDTTGCSKTLYVTKKTLYVSVNGEKSLIPAQGTAGLIFRHTGFEEILLFL